MHIKFLKLLATQLSILFFLAMSLVIPKFALASELIGTHLGEGDVGYQINIIRNVLIPNGLEPGSPVTVMVPVTMIQDSQLGTVQELANAVSSAGYFPIVRINGVCSNFSAETGKGPGETVDAVRSIFGSQALIVWGNEINNKENECNDWQKYLSDYIQIEGRPNVSPAALDYYMGNPDFTVSKMFADTPGMEAIFNTSPRAANAYGCVGSNSADCDPSSTTTQEVGYGSVGNPFYLTEFSLSPGGNASDAPDTDIAKVLEFIASRAGETGAQKVTPLVRNVCNNDSAWLIYINGKLFTPQGNEVSENCEGISGGSGYDLSRYPEYGVDETKSYITPIRNLIDGASTQYTVAALREELAKQGYEAYCASENIKIDPKYDTEELINRYFELYPDGVQILEADSVETLSTTNAQYPLWRDVSNKQFLLTSLEEYFGFKDIYQSDPGASVLTSAPINSLLSEPQMCVQGWKNLVAQELACERLQNPGECELFIRPIPGTSYTVKTLLDALKAYEPGYREGMATKGCTNLVAGDRLLNPKLFEGLINTPTYFDRAYRYGFIVAVIHAKSPLTDSGNIAARIFNFFTESTRTEEPRDEVLVAAFKLPDIATNKFQDETNGVQFWDDPLSLTRLLLSNHERNELHAKDFDKTNAVRSRTETAADLFENANDAKVQNSGSKIFCSISSEDGDGNQVITKASTSCRNNMTKALTDIINGNAQGCGDVEAVNVIKDIAGLDNPEEKYGRVFNGDNGLEVILNLFKGDKTHPAAGSGNQTDPQRAETNDPAEKLKSLFTLSKDTWGSREGGTTVDFYVVYPMGFELNAVEDAMKGAFFTKAQIAALDSQQIVDGFPLTGQSMSLSAGSDGFEYIDPEKTAAGDCGTEQPVDPITGLPVGTPVPKPCTQDVSVTLSQESGGVGILGAKLGFWMRKIQTQLSSRTGEAWKYFSSCKTTEEFMLGKCTGGSFAGSDDNTGDGSPGTSGDDLVSVAQCNGGPRITAGGDAEHVSTTGTGACAGKETNEYVPSIHNVSNWKSPGDAVIDCEDLYSYADCTYPESLVQNPVNSSGKFVENGNVTACQYVVNKAKELGVSPRLALAMWGEESGFSHYRVPDLGVISQPAQDLEAQVTSFANTLKSYSNYIDFLEAYSGEERGDNDPSPNQFCNNLYFPARLKVFYDSLGPR